MKAPSRRMSPLPMLEPMGRIGFAVLGALALAFVGSALWLVHANPEIRWIVGAVVLLLAVGFFWSDRRWRRKKQERRSDSICTFARSLPARTHDTWVVRAVYEELSRDRGIGIRPTDRWKTDLAFDPEDFDECVVEIAKRSRRSLANNEGNPWYGRVRTVADLISFLEHQPKIESLSHNSV